jgi:hypothetical protein
MAVCGAFPVTPSAALPSLYDPLSLSNVYSGFLDSFPNKCGRRLRGLHVCCVMSGGPTGLGWLPSKLCRASWHPFKKPVPKRPLMSSNCLLTLPPMGGRCFSTLVRAVVNSQCGPCVSVFESTVIAQMRAPRIL